MKRKFLKVCFLLMTVVVFKEHIYVLSTPIREDKDLYPKILSEFLITRDAGKQHFQQINEKESPSYKPTKDLLIKKSLKEYISLMASLRDNYNTGEDYFRRIYSSLISPDDNFKHISQHENKAAADVNIAEIIADDVNRESVKDLVRPHDTLVYPFRKNPWNTQDKDSTYRLRMILNRILPPSENSSHVISGIKVKRQRRCYWSVITCF